MKTLEIVIGTLNKPWLRCMYGHGSFRCGSYIEIDQSGVFHFCTQPKAHGIVLSLTEVLDIARLQGPEFERAINDTINSSKTPSLGDSPSEALSGETPEQEGGISCSNEAGHSASCHV